MLSRIWIFMRKAVNLFSPSDKRSTVRVTRYLEMHPKSTCNLCGKSVNPDLKIEVKNWDNILYFCGQDCWGKWIDKMVE